MLTGFPGYFIEEVSAGVLNMAAVLIGTHEHVRGACYETHWLAALGALAIPVHPTYSPVTKDSFRLWLI